MISLAGNIKNPSIIIQYKLDNLKRKYITSKYEDKKDVINELDQVKKEIDNFGKGFDFLKMQAEIVLLEVRFNYILDDFIRYRLVNQMKESMGFPATINEIEAKAKELSSNFQSSIRNYQDLEVKVLNSKNVLLFADVIYSRVFTMVGYITISPFANAALTQPVINKESINVLKNLFSNLDKCIEIYKTQEAIYYWLKARLLKCEMLYLVNEEKKAKEEAINIEMQANIMNYQDIQNQAKELNIGKYMFSIFKDKYSKKDIDKEFENASDKELEDLAKWIIKNNSLDEDRLGNIIKSLKSDQFNLKIRREWCCHILIQEYNGHQQSKDMFYLIDS